MDRFCGSHARETAVVSLLTLAGMLLAACASGGQSSQNESTQATGTDDGQSAVIVVENTESPGRSISVDLVSAAGDRRLLGSVGPRRTEAFEVPLKSGVSYRLVAGLTGGGNVSSERFSMAPGARITWTLPLNSLRTSP
jgi:hypothetical protein